MKVILYMAITANGYIAKEDDNTDWISSVEWDSYSKVVRKAGNLVIGHRTYDILTKQAGFKEFEKVKVIIVSKKEFKDLSSTHLTVKTCKEALDLLKSYEEVIVAGGGQLDTGFMQQGLIDEVYLDIEPILFGKGIKLFSDSDFETKLKLLEIKNLDQNVIQLHYRVEKN